jgi:hypothetical protein
MAENFGTMIDLLRDINTTLTGNMSFDPFGLYTVSATQSTGNNTWTTLTTLIAEAGGSYANLGTGTITIPVGSAGYYGIFGNLQVLTTAGTNLRWQAAQGFRINSGGDQTQSFEMREISPADNNGLFDYTAWFTVRYLNDGDTIQYRYFGLGNSAATVYANWGTQLKVGFFRLPIAI